MAVDGCDPQVIWAAYASVAEEYALTFGNDLVDLELAVLLDEIAARCTESRRRSRPRCGPRTSRNTLIARAVDCVGVDFTLAMLTVAQHTRSAGLPLVAADIRSLGVRGGIDRWDRRLLPAPHLERCRASCRHARAASRDSRSEECS